MVNGSAVFLCELLVGVFIGTLIGAVILKASCALYNMLVGASGTPAGGMAAEPDSALAANDDWANYQRITSSAGVPKPRIEWAMGIVFFAALVNAGASFIILRIFRTAGQAAGHGVRGTLPIYFLVFIPLHPRPGRPERGHAAHQLRQGAARRSALPPPQHLHCRDPRRLDRAGLRPRPRPVRLSPAPNPSGPEA